MMDIHEILKKLPHRYPFLMVDRITAIEKGVSWRRPQRYWCSTPWG